jgi:hypothetical protein
MMARSPQVAAGVAEQAEGAHGPAAVYREIESSQGTAITRRRPERSHRTVPWG